jgi:hypothetical protein
MTARQLHLFKSRKQRGTMPPPPSEFASQVFLVDLIRALDQSARLVSRFAAIGGMLT